MPTSVRLDPETEATLRRLARQRSTTQSDVIRDAVAAYGAAEDEEPTLYERIRHIIGSAPPGPVDLSTDTGKKFGELLRAREEKKRR